MATAQTVSELLKQANIHFLAHALKAVKLDEFFAGQIPRWVVRTGLVNQAEQIFYTENGQPVTPVKQAFQVMQVTLSDDTPLHRRRRPRHSNDAAQALPDRAPR